MPVTAKNLTALRERARVLSGVRMTTLKPNAEVDTLVNEAYLELCDLEDWSFKRVDGTINTVAGTATYTLPAPVSDIEFLATEGDGDRGVLAPVPRTAIAADDFLDDDQDLPVAYMLSADGTQVTLIPTPDAVYTLRVRGWKEVDELGPTDAPIFAAKYHPVVAYMAAILILEEQGDDSGRAEDYLGVVASYVGRMEREYLRQKDKTGVVMGGRALGGPTYRRLR